MFSEVKGSLSGDANRQTRRIPISLTKRHRGFTFLVVALVLLLLAVTRSHSIISSTQGLLHRDRQKTDNLDEIRNATLGFQKVYGINLPSRPDKLDSLLLQAHLTNITIDIRDGVLGTELSREVLPHQMASKMDNNSIGCWRAHMDVFQEMVRDNVQSALIFEDDADWDIGLKAQLVEYARGARWLLREKSNFPHSPYGDDWDVLWIGHCHSEPLAADGRRWVIPHDPTAVPEKSRIWWGVGPNMTHWENPQTRVIYPAGQSWCLSAYAVSLRAAKRSLWKQSMMPSDWKIDGKLGDLCAGNPFKHVNCISTFPRMVGRGIGAGPRSRTSDIDTFEEDISNTSRIENVMFSARMNVPRLVSGSQIFLSAFENPSGNELALDQIVPAQGHPEYVDKDDKVAEGHQKELFKNPKKPAYSG